MKTLYALQLTTMTRHLGVDPIGQGDMSPIFEIYLTSVNFSKSGQSILRKIIMSGTHMPQNGAIKWYHIMAP